MGLVGGEKSEKVTARRIPSGRDCGDDDLEPSRRGACARFSVTKLHLASLHGRDCEDRFNGLVFESLDVGREAIALRDQYE